MTIENPAQAHYIIPTSITDSGVRLRTAYQFLQVRVQKVGRGMANEILSLHVNGKRLKPGVQTLDEFLNYLGAQGFRIVTAEMETEGVYTYFYTLQREILTDQQIEADIYDQLAAMPDGASFGQSARNLIEFIGMGDNW